MAADLQTVAQLLDATLNSTQHKQAEAQLKIEEQKPEYSILLLRIVSDASLPVNTRLSSALYFKNFVKYNYIDEEGGYKLPEQEIATIKQELIGLMISVPSMLQAQLGEAISIIAESDFWEKWDTLVDDLVGRLTADNAKVNNGVLEVAHSIFRKWRPLFRSDDLFTEINHVLQRFGEPFLGLLQHTDANIEANKNNKEALQAHFQTMNLLMKLFYDLSCQDLPPVFEDNLNIITPLLQKYLTYDNSLLKTDDDAEAGPEEHVKAGICEVLVLYVQKYDDAFGAVLPPFITSAWNLLTTIGPETKYDILVSKALHFLTAVAGIQVHAQNFNNQEILGQVVEKVILPNVALRESDVEMFEDEPIEYIRRDLEGSDADTRRRAATDFLRKLMEQFPELVTGVVGKYIQHYLTAFTQNSSDWKSKDTAVYLFSAIAATGTITAAQGVKTTNPQVDVVDFFQRNIANDLIADTGVEPIIKVDAIKFLYTFRSQLTKQQWQAAFPPLIKNLAAENYVVYTYAAIAVERVLFLTNDNKEHIFNKEDVTPLSKDLCEHLFQLIERESAPEKIQENEFLMRCVMRVLIVIKDGVLPITDILLQHFIKITEIIGQNPSNPKFYYYHFEAIGALVRYAAPSQPEKLEQALYSPFAAILGSDVQEFMPYVFQLFAALLEAHPTGALSDFYVNLINPILTPALWESKGNVPALSRFLTSMIPRGASVMAANNQLEPILGIFQRLMAGKVKTEAYAIDLLEAVVSSFPTSSLNPYFPQVLNIIFQRLGDDRQGSDAFKLRFARLYHFISARDLDLGLGADWFVTQCDVVEPNAYVGLYLKIILPTTEKLSRPLDRKIAAISLTKTLCDSQAFAQKYQKGWGFTCQALLKLLENPPVIGNAADEVVELDVDDVGFGVGFTPLNTCRKTGRDDWPQVVDVKRWVGQYLKEADARKGGAVAQFVQTRLGDVEKQALASYMQ